MKSLTEQWKKGELPEGFYYIIDDEEVIIDYYLCDYWERHFDSDVHQVLAPVPSYKELQEKQKSLKVLAETYCKEKEENRQLETQIAKLTEIVGVLPSNHSVGNLGYKIKNQRHEINNRLKEIDKLKELLKECYKMLAQYQVENSEPSLDKNIELLTKIDEVLK